MFSMRIPLFVFIFLLLKTVLSQQKEETIIESKKFYQVDKDTLKVNKKNSLDEKVKGVSKKKPSKKRLIPFIKPMDDVSKEIIKYCILMGVRK
mgnify:CR=1 FL=1